MDPDYSNIRPIIDVEDVSVRYRVPRERIGTLKEYTIRWLQRRIKHVEFLALDHVSFKINQSEVLGVIGHNGAGKSTLLKLLARVLRPTTGRVIVHGKVAPLLEIGAGFHPELTGRENIFLNGAILGYTKKQIEDKFQRIIDFADLWDFIDAPMRTYSSGMWARLGFAVATDEKPDILIIDEILAVGDEEFQQKSYGRINDFKDSGATILIVSHDLSALQKLCQNIAWLHHGRLQEIGPADLVISHYLSFHPE